MQPTHLQQINRAAEALGKWLLSAVERLKRMPAEANAAAPSTLFTASMVSCPTCRKQIAEELFAAHQPLCLAREQALEKKQWEGKAQLELQQAHARHAPSRPVLGLERCAQNIKPLLVQTQALGVLLQTSVHHPVSRSDTEPGAAVAVPPPLRQQHCIDARALLTSPSPAIRPMATPRQTPQHSPQHTHATTLQPPPQPSAAAQACRATFVANKCGLTTRARPESSSLWPGADPGYDYLRSRSGFARALPPRSSDANPGPRAEFGRRGGSTCSESAVPQVLTQTDHVKVIRSRLERNFGPAASSRS